MKRLCEFSICFICWLTLCNYSLQAQKQLTTQQQSEISVSIEQAKQFENSGDYNQAANLYSKVASTYWVNGSPNDAIDLLKKALEMSAKIGNTNAAYNFCTNIGMIYTDDEDYPKALEYFQKSLDAAKQLKRKPEIASSLINIGNTNTELKNYSGAIKNLEEASSIAQETNETKLLRNCYSQMASIYEKMGNTAKSAEYFSLYSAISRKIQQDEARRREGQAQQMVETAQSKVKAIEVEKKATEQELQQKKQSLKDTEENLEKVEQLTLEQQMHIDLLNKENELRDAVIRTQKLIRNIFIVIILGVLGFAILIYQSLKSKKKANALLAIQNKEIAAQNNTIEQKSKELQLAFGKIEKQNLDITGSITYAQRIQQAMLPVEEHLTSVIPDSFVMLKPRDIVSGDFYWYSGYASAKLHKEKPRKNFMKLHNIPSDDSGFIIAAVDCTGHGVPGAFMSMIGFNLLETITRNGNVTPNEILFEMHLMVRYMLKQNNSDNTDGMDMSICCIKDDGRRLLYAGAKNPLYLVSKGELTVIKPDPMPIGGPQKENLREFTLHDIDISEPTSCYIFTDGYIDQFGGSPTKKFSSASMRQLLLEVSHLPMQQQKLAIEDNLAKWKGNHRQIDDILVMGFKIGTKDIEI
jgi:serine phosphatase RsbU (regulator of sigma subunit)